MSQTVVYYCDRCDKQVTGVPVTLTLPIPVGHITRTDCWKYTPSAPVDLCQPCALSYRQWFEKTD